MEQLKLKRGRANPQARRCIALIAWISLSLILPSALAVEIYLPNLDRPEALKLFPPPPAPDSEEEKMDRDTFTNTRKLAGTPRWSAARSDSSRAIHALLGDFSCSAGIKIKEHRYPQLSVLVFRTIATGEATVNLVKTEYRRPRPFRLQSGPLCLAFAEYRVSAFDYPSGHATSGWLTGLLLAELWPAHSKELLLRAREYSESRVICGVHSLSATKAAETLARSLFEKMKQTASFQRDLAKAKAEITKNMSSAEPPDQGSCREQSQTLSVGPTF